MKQKTNHSHQYKTSSADGRCKTESDTGFDGIKTKLEDNATWESGFEEERYYAEDDVKQAIKNVEERTKRELFCMMACCDCREDFNKILSEEIGEKGGALR